jgi:hypothetical protein
MGRMYSLTFDEQTITNAGGDRDFFYIAPADDKPVLIHAISFSPAGAGDLGDAQEETLRWAIIRGHTTVGSGGTAYTASAVGRENPADPDPAFTARHNDTTIASAGTTFTLHAGKFNNRVGYDWIPPDRIRTAWCSQAQTSIVVRLLSAPADDLTMSGTLYVEEFG